MTDVFRNEWDPIRKDNDDLEAKMRTGFENEPQTWKHVSRLMEKGK